MVLVDTSIWIQFLSGRLKQLEELKELLIQEKVICHPFVYGELFIGDKGGRINFLADYEKMTSATTVPHVEVVKFVRTRNLYGRGIGWIDVHMLASTCVDGYQLWTSDLRLHTLACELGVEYNPVS